MCGLIMKFANAKYYTCNIHVIFTNIIHNLVKGADPFTSGAKASELY